MRIVRILAAVTAATIQVFAQDQPATAATRNLFTTNSVTGTNLFAGTNRITRALGLMEALQLALTNNFDVRIDRFNPAIAKTDVDAARGAYDPTISGALEHRQEQTDSRDAATESVSVGLNGVLPTGATYNFGINALETGGILFPTNRLFRTGSGAATVIGASQPLLRNLWIDQTRYNIAVSRKALKISELAFRQRLIATVSSVEQAYFEWIAARENVRVQEEAVSLARQQARDYALRAQIGVAKPLDEQRFEAQASSSEASLLVARRTLRERETALINLVTTEFEAWHDLALEPVDQLPTIGRVFDAQGSWTRAFEHRPDLHQLIVDLERLGLTEKLRYNQIFPTLNLGGAFGYNASGESFGRALGDLSDANKPVWSVGLEASFPIGNRTARAALKGTRLEKEQANERLRQARQTIMVQVENAIIDARTGWERIPATRQAREYAAAALEAGQKRLAAGTATALEILTLQRDLTSARSDEIRALVDYNKAVTVLLEREGTLLDERGLNLNVR